MKTLEQLGYRKSRRDDGVKFTKLDGVVIFFSNGKIYMNICKATQELFDAIKLELKKPKLAEEVKQFIRCLPPEIKWAACDNGGVVYAFVEKPYKKENCWVNNGACYSLEVFKHLLSPYISWYDTEPINLDEWRASL